MSISLEVVNPFVHLIQTECLFVSTSPSQNLFTKVPVQAAVFPKPFSQNNTVVSWPTLFPLLHSNVYPFIHTLFCFLLISMKPLSKILVVMSHLSAALMPLVICFVDALLNISDTCCILLLCLITIPNPPVQERIVLFMCSDF